MTLGTGLLPALGPSGLETDEVYELLRNERRRYAFHYLQQVGDTVSLRDLSDQVAAWEYETAVDDLESAQRQRVYVSLRQNHLPRMAEAGVVAFDPDANTVDLAPNASNLRVYLEAVPQDDILWAEYFLGLTAICTTFLVMVWIGVPPFPDFVEAVGLVVVGVLAVSALLHRRHLSRRRLGAGDTPY